MKSPFPGMDPYIEAHGHLWEDFHHHLIEDIFRTLAAVIPDNYLVRTQRRAYVVLAEAEGKEESHFQGDVTGSSPGSTRPKQAPGATAVDVTSDVKSRHR